jgi:Lrp/AsnC family transcriptional regulator for asnA, asnC and gidA
MRVLPGFSARSLAGAASELKSATFVATCSGRYDVLLELACTSAAEFQQVLDGEVRMLSGLGAVEAHIYLSLQYRPLVPA